MADPVNVAFNVTERGFDKILRDVGLLRSELEALGVDVSGPVQRALNGIETTSVKVTRSIKNIGKASDETGKSLKGWSESLTQVWARQFREAEKAEKIAQRLAQTTANARSTEVGGRNYGNASTSIDAIITARQEQNRVFTAQIQQRLQGEAREAEKAARAVDRLAQASARRAKVEEDYYRNRYQQNNRNAMADFDAEFKALDDLSKANSAASDPSTRYALYDVAAAYTAIGASLAGVAIYSAVVGADFQAAFASVARTTEPLVATDEYLGNLRNSLVQLSGQIPLTFRELSEIATLGNQLGIDENAIDSFTGTVARFASVSGLSADEVSRAFGGIRAQTGLSEIYFENLASAMALVSVRSNATEAQIISLTREIAASASLSGFAIDEVVGLAGALASLQVAPERARGVLDTYFTQLNTAVREGGESLEAFSRITGKTGEDLTNLVRSGEGLEVFQSVLQGLATNSGDVVELDANLEALGLTGLRASNTFQRFVNSLGVADKAFADANEGFLSGEEAIRQYGITAETLQAQFTILVNGINALVDAVSGGAVENFGELLRVINNLIFAFAEWLGNNRFIAGLIGFGIAVAGVTGALFLVRGGLAAARAATIAMAQATAAMSGAALGSVASLGTLIKALFGVQVGMTRATAAAAIFRRTLPGLIATGAAFGLSFLAEKFFQVEDKAGDARIGIDEYNAIAQASKFASQGAGTGAEDLADSLGGGGGVADAAEEAAIKVRTLVDYVNDLQGVFNRSSEIRFGSQEALDNITLKWIELNEEIAKYQQQVRSLTAERGLKEYFLGIAEAYDDQLRAAQLREEIAKIDDDLAVAQAGASTELTGNTRAAIENRKVFRDLLGSYEDYVSALASAGASQEQIQAVISQLNQDFGAQATALGFNSGEIQNYGDRFNDLSTIVARVPREITVTFNGDPALQALNEFFAVAEEQARQAGNGIGNALNDGIGGGIGEGDPFADLFAETRKLPAQGRTAGDDWWSNFINGVTSRPFNLIPIVGPYITEFIEKGFPDGFEWGDRFINGILEIFAGRNPFEKTRTHRGEQASADGRALGITFGSSVSDSASARLSADNSVNAWISNQNANAYNNGRTVGSNIGGGIAAGLASALSGRQVGAKFTKPYSSGGFVTPNLFADGGYTGPGHWLQPAGVVHAGEYVIPKKHVNQSTGLPDPSYVANLQRGRSAPKAGYATGGYVGGQSGPIDLTAGTINAITRGLSVNLNVGPTRLAQSVSKGDRTLAFTGSN